MSDEDDDDFEEDADDLVLDEGDPEALADEVERFLRDREA
jgi:hypothetical protein